MIFLHLSVYIPTTSDRGGGDFMAVDMVDRKIRLLWNNGGGASTKVITHNVTIDAATSRGNLLTDDHMWYKITAERTGNIGRLNVRKVKPVKKTFMSFISALIPTEKSQQPRRNLQNIYPFTITHTKAPIGPPKAIIPHSSFFQSINVTIAAFKK